MSCRTGNSTHGFGSPAAELSFAIAERYWLIVPQDMPSFRRCSRNRHKPSARCRETTGKIGISCAALNSSSCDTHRWYASHVRGFRDAPMVSRYDAA
eukprot:1177063-Rhodomonas_salina.2